MTDRDDQRTAAQPGRARLAALARIGRRRAAAGRLLLPAPLGWLVIAYLGLALHPAAQRVLGEGRVHRQGRAVRLVARRVRGRSSATTVYRTDRHPDGRHGHPGHAHRRAPRLPDRLLHGAHRLAAHPRACSSSPSSCRSGRPTSSRSTPGGSSSRATACVDWVLAPFGIDGPGPRRAHQHAGSCSATCGCRT